MTSAILNDTIVAQATPPGKGGVGIIRLSGSKATEIGRSIAGTPPAPRLATFRNFKAEDGSSIDQGLVILFEAPNSFTGEDVLELQGHGGPVVMGMILDRCVQLGARIARPGEFSERAFLNDKIDLSQAEAIADLIDSVSSVAAKSAVRSLQGEFSSRISELTENVTRLRMYVEAAIDFPEEEIDFLADDVVSDMLNAILVEFQNITKSATQGALLREGVSLVLAGRPNAGKSSLINLLTGKQLSIVTPIPGTTRDIVDDYIHLDGLPLRLIDTAGLRETGDEIEIEGVRRALGEIEKADHLMLIVDAVANEEELRTTVEALHSEVVSGIPVTVVINKIDLNPTWHLAIENCPRNWIPVSAKTGAGIDLLRSHLKEALGYQALEEGTFIARSRHIDALGRAEQFVKTGQQRLVVDKAGELLAEELKFCQQALGEITGEVGSDDLLGRIFSSFCIGK
jgi:tRNA modification GTPase